MKTFIAKDVLRDYTCGMVVISARNIDEAKLIIAKDFEYKSHVGEILNNLVELEKNKIEYVFGGG